ncbi:hypothetical protein GA0061071_101178 [Kosakonia oryzendophytica]|uniref:Glycerophosphoryl diester phosphodiesterase n=1 Tax=Kosakonia oryzendophytica TaxID=1005665 RepID=A0A1C3YVM1_9ENTR|nr:hypothetical protein [Kosakonia oryzendophytica]AMO48164.1 Hypothetical protein AKI40_1754 [Enterobacter sp. FY-07]WBT59822.1 phosphodiesterase [Kosakonia oryzendophytica]SCB74147.1 hypothetical protein GA0061071_101178 [Kosakonia oryzendophytica]
MKIISHRGYWKESGEKNTEIAFTRSFSLGYGTETDVRDYHGALVISHDIADVNSVPFDDFIKHASQYGTVENKLTLALNVKADGLANKMASVVENYPTLDCFVFDMSIPDMRGYFDSPLAVFTRISEVETQAIWLDKCAGVWLDAFDGEWYSAETILSLLDTKKRVCVVSSELHGRENKGLWEMLLPFSGESNLILCTDVPEKASEYFFGK